MSTDVLQRFRKGLTEGRFTMTEIARESGIPLTTLSYIRNSDWGDGVVDKIAKIDRALKRVDAAPAIKRKRNGKAQATA
jgi:predicted transcriptional regulator